MPDAVNPTAVNPPAPAIPTSANPTTAGAIATSNNSPAVSSSTKINSMEELREKAPKLYQMMLEGIAMKICGDMKRSQDEIKRIMREARRRQ